MPLSFSTSIFLSLSLSFSLSSSFSFFVSNLLLLFPLRPIIFTQSGRPADWHSGEVLSGGVLSFEIDEEEQEKDDEEGLVVEEEGVVVVEEEGVVVVEEVVVEEEVVEVERVVEGKLGNDEAETGKAFNPF